MSDRKDGRLWHSTSVDSAIPWMEGEKLYESYEQISGTLLQLNSAIPWMKGSNTRMKSLALQEQTASHTLQLSGCAVGFLETCILPTTLRVMWSGLPV